MPRIGPCQVLAATLTLSQPGGGRLCLPYTGILGWLKFAVAALAFSLGLVFQFFEIATLCHPKCVYCVETAHRTNYIKCL